MTNIRAQAQKQERQLRQLESLGDNVVRAFVADFQRRAIAAVKSGGKVKLTAAERETIVGELADLMLLGFVRRYRQEKRELGIELSLSFSKEVSKLAKGFDLDLGSIRDSFVKVARKRTVESVVSIETRINQELARVTARQQPTAIATREMRRRLSEMGLAAQRPALVETLVRTHAQIAYSAAQSKLDSDDPDGIIWGYTLSIVGDDRTSDICIQPGVDGFTAPKDDPLWDIWTPPLHWNCRTQKIAITRPAEKTKLPRGAKVGDGFDFNPGKLLAA